MIRAGAVPVSLWETTSLPRVFRKRGKNCEQPTTRLDPTEPLAGAVDEGDPEPQNEDSEGQPKLRTGHLVREGGTNSCPNEHGGGQDQRRRDVYIVIPVIL